MILNSLTPSLNKHIQWTCVLFRKEIYLSTAFGFQLAMSRLWGVFNVFFYPEWSGKQAISLRKLEEIFVEETMENPGSPRWWSKVVLFPILRRFKEKIIPLLLFFFHYFSIFLVTLFAIFLFFSTPQNHGVPFQPVVSSISRQVYILNRDSAARLTISSPLEAHKSYLENPGGWGGGWGLLLPESMQGSFGSPGIWWGNSSAIFFGLWEISNWQASASLLAVGSRWSEFEISDGWWEMMGSVNGWYGWYGRYGCVLWVWAHPSHQCGKKLRSHSCLAFRTKVVIFKGSTQTTTAPKLNSSPLKSYLRQKESSLLTIHFKGVC